MIKFKKVIYSYFFFQVANVFYKLFKKTGGFDENIHITKDQVDVKSQNQLNLFFETKNLFKKRMWEASG